ncbi:osmoprotectant transport system ATP-binding protein [Ancylobacter sp. 3268]|uniref:ABC transporter ATP-binding protein n=1 Tax=Ancylobacter sp. 3268 TaxID=2817752 RepID=UPI0028624AF8|nr:ABC transporter ATP-binding protein [Ancylobacter sp. 3268]MDR6950708.1 osmoprotectant transport system ATP-binding protein [Ancylobacter sp. 3268]
MIVLDRLTKRYGNAVSVDQLSLTVPTGSICALVGASGGGKTTTLRLINRLIEPDEGRVLIDGTDAASLAPVALRRHIGYVIQSVGLFPHWNVARNIATVPNLLGWKRDRIERRIDELLDLVGLDPASYRDRRPHELSGGQQQRVGVARALAADPDLLLMDEPFGALDPVTRDGLQLALLDIQARTGKTIVIVTHDIDEAIRLASLIAVLDGGRLIQHGSPHDLLARPANAFVEAFVGGPQRGLRLLQVTRVRERTDFGESIGGTPIDADVTLDIALERMVTTGAHRLPVYDRAADRYGTLALADIALRNGRQA